MAKFIQIPLCGTASAGTLPVPGAVTVANGSVTAVALGTAGTIQTTAPIIIYTPADNQGSGAIIAPTYASGIITGYTIVNGGTGYTTTTTGIAIATWPPLQINAEKVLSIGFGAVSGTSGATNVLVLRMDTVTTPTLTLTFGTSSAAVATDFGFQIRGALQAAIQSANNVKDTSQVTSITQPTPTIPYGSLPFGALLLSAVYS